MDGRLHMLLSVLSQDQYVKLEEAERRLHLSQRTVRTLVGQLDDILRQQGASIERRRGLGIRLVVSDEDRYQRFLGAGSGRQIPETGRQRMGVLLTELFCAMDGYVKAEELCDLLCVSRKTLSADLKSTEQYLNKHHLQLERKPYYGLRITGSEFDRRLCLSAMFYEIDPAWLLPVRDGLPDQELVCNQMLACIKQSGYTIYEMDIPNMVLQIRIALYRMGQGCGITLDEMQHSSLLQESDIRTAQICAAGLSQALGVAIPIPEVKYLAIQLLGKKKAVNGGRDQLFIDMEINQLVNRMLESVYQAFLLDFRSDFDLNTSLRQHMVSLRIRLQYRLRLDNPILKEIKEVYSFPYAVAAHGSTVLAEHFHTIVPEEEIGYLALCFALSLKRQNRQKYKRNILLVCASGVGSAKLFEYRFREMFEEYLDRIETCEIGALVSMDFTNIDYVFSTVPVEAPLPVPVCQVQYFFDRHNINEVERILKHENADSICRYFHRDLFFTDIGGSTREEILHNLCRRIGAARELPGDFEQCVLKRENLMQTDFCRYTAIPHPYKPITRDTFVAVAILEKPVLWHMYEVQVIFLLSISDQKENLEDFYNTVPKFMMEEPYIKRLLLSRKFETLMDIIKTVEQTPLGSSDM